MGQDNKQGVKHRPDEKVFPDLVDHAGLIDGIVLGVYGQRRLTPSRLVAISPSRPVGGPDRKYSQAANGICKPTGNPFQELFAVMGRFRRFPRVPPVTVKIRSQAVPLSCAQVELVTAALMRQRYRLVVSAVELSFDVTGYSVEYFVKHIQTRARRFRILRNRQSGKIETFYIGAPASAWQACVYQKPDDVVRCEFVLRRRFLREHGIRQPHEILLLRRINSGRLMRLRRVDKKRLAVIGDPMTGTCQNRVLCIWARMFTSAEFAAALKDQKIVRPDLFLPCGLERKLRKMQRGLIW